MIFLLLISMLFWQDRERPPYPFIIQSQNGAYYFKMSPSKKAPYDRELGEGYAFKIAAGDEDELVWSTTKWYAYEIYLANDGEHLIRIGNIPRGKKQSDKHLAIAFYRNGKLIKKYSTLRLLGNYQVQPTASHYQFKGDEAGIENEVKKIFKLKLVNNQVLRFNFTNGDILEGAKPDKPEFMSQPVSDNLDQKKAKNIKKKN
ncbi:MAG: hypothetical protein KDD94_05025 [Calditrichaeota bacterium]|nr:hypothetical protein [Calditrichota bacterium]